MLPIVVVKGRNFLRLNQSVNGDILKNTIQRFLVHPLDHFRTHISGCNGNASDPWAIFFLIFLKNSAVTTFGMTDIAAFVDE